jgi:hypothetical protein
VLATLFAAKFCAYNLSRDQLPSCPQPRGGQRRKRPIAKIETMARVPAMDIDKSVLVTDMRFLSRTTGYCP